MSGVFFCSDTNKRVDQGWGSNKGNAELTAEQQADSDVAKDANVDAAMSWGADLVATGDDTPATDSWGGGDDVKPSSPNAANGTAETRRSKEKDEEEDNSLTLDEYLAQKAKAEATAVPKLETVRQANEGVDESLWKDTIPLAKGKDESNYFVGKVGDLVFYFSPLIFVLADQVGSKGSSQERREDSY